MKKLFLLFIVCNLFLVGCASTGGSGSELPSTLEVPAMEKKFEKNFQSNPLKKTNVKGIYVIHPFDGMQSYISKSCKYEIEICDKKSGQSLYTVKDVVVHWTGMYGWNNQVAINDLTFITSDCIQYIIKENKFSWNIIVEDGYVLDGMDNPMIKTEIDSVYVIKPGYFSNIKNYVDRGIVRTIEILDKTTNEVVKSFDNVVTSWTGMSGWNGQVIENDYTFITKDKKQYIVKSDKYNVRGEVPFYNPTQTDFKICYSNWMELATIKAGESVTEKIFLNTPYYIWNEKGFLGQTKIEIQTSSISEGFILGLSSPEKGKKYMVLNQYKTNQLEEENDHFGFCLFEVVKKEAENAYKYSDTIYIRSYPSGRFWINDSKLADKLIGTEIIYEKPGFGKNNFTHSPANCWGWATEKDGILYHHFIYKDNITYRN